MTRFDINVCAHARRLLGKLVISLQHVVSSGKMWLREQLTDSNLSPTNVRAHTHTHTHTCTVNLRFRKNGGV